MDKVVLGVLLLTASFGMAKRPGITLNKIHIHALVQALTGLFEWLTVWGFFLIR